MTMQRCDGFLLSLYFQSLLVLHVRMDPFPLVWRYVSSWCELLLMKFLLIQSNMSAHLLQVTMHQKKVLKQVAGWLVGVRGVNEDDDGNYDVDDYWRFCGRFTLRIGHCHVQSHNSTISRYTNHQVFVLNQIIIVIMMTIIVLKAQRYIYAEIYLVATM